MYQYDVTFHNTSTNETKLHTVNAENKEQACIKACALMYRERDSKYYRLSKVELVEIFTILASPLIKVKDLLCK